MVQIVVVSASSIGIGALLAAATKGALRGAGVMMTSRDVKPPWCRTSTV